MDSNVQISLSTDSADVRPLNELIENPRSLFIEDFPFKELTSYLGAKANDYPDLEFQRVKTLVDKAMSLRASGENTLVIAYQGRDTEFGKALVGFYAHRLIKGIRIGMRSQSLQTPKQRASRLTSSVAGQKNSPAGILTVSPTPSEALRGSHGSTRAGDGEPQADKRLAVANPSVRFIGEIEVQSVRPLQHSARIFSSLLILLGSLLAILLSLGVIEWSDSSLKSDRQVARYLELPVLGSLPDINKITEILSTRR